MQAIDMFAGAGGFTEAARMAGVPVIWAANHWPEAVACHQDNHRSTVHSCQDLHQADWRQIPRHDLLLAAPACQGHTPARGLDRPYHDASRSTAWAVISAAEYHRPAVVIVENVPGFLAWQLWPTWQDAFSRLGYSLSMHVIDAADHGVPQHRRRLFIVATRARTPLSLRLERQAHRPIAPVIQWDAYPWTPVRTKAPATRARVAAGSARFGRRFLAPYYSSGSGLTGRSLDRPIGTITTVDRWAAVDGDRIRMLQPVELRAAMGFRDDYRLPVNRRLAIHLLGNAVCPPAGAEIIRAVAAAA